MTVRFTWAVPEGMCVGVTLPAMSADEVSLLNPAEREAAARLSATRQPTWVGGRLALRHALQTAGAGAAATAALLSLPTGAPSLPPGWAGSISHKSDLAVALAARADAGSLGIDCEYWRPRNLAIAARVLRPEERAALARLPDALRWQALMLAFSAKEALYKALHPHLRRFVGFQEAAIDHLAEQAWLSPSSDAPSGLDVTLHLPERSALAATGHWMLHDDKILVGVRVQMKPPGNAAFAATRHNLG